MPRPEKRTITLTIDGREVKASENAMLVDAAKHGDVEIPVFCYEPKLGQPVGACGAWTAENTFTASICFVETPFIATVRLTFTGGEVRCETAWNLSFGAKKEQTLVGVAK